MALNIKNEDVERLVAEVATATGQSKTETVRKALEAQRRRLTSQHRSRKIRSFLQYLEEEVWNEIPVEVLEKPLSKAEREAILGYGPEGA
jgi:antitoxin VapB